MRKALALLLGLDAAHLDVVCDAETDEKKGYEDTSSDSAADERLRGGEVIDIADGIWGAKISASWSSA